MNRWRRWLLRNAGHALLPLAVVWLVGIGGAVGGWWRPKPVFFSLLIGSFVGAMILAIWSRWQREVAVREAAIPQYLKRKLRETYPHLTGKDCDLVERGLRQNAWGRADFHSPAQTRSVRETGYPPHRWYIPPRVRALEETVRCATTWLFLRAPRCRGSTDVGR